MTIEASFTVERVQDVVNHLTKHFSCWIPTTLFKLQEELNTCKGKGAVTDKMAQWLRVVRNTLFEGNRMVMTENKAYLLEFIIGGK